MESQNKVPLFTCNQPCNNCPYRTDAPKKLWHRKEFRRLLDMENDLFGTIYHCHKNNGSICVGWFMKQLEAGCPSLMLRLAMIKKDPGKEYIDSLNSPAPLFKSVKAMIRANFKSLLNKRNGTKRI